jgi:hypothetical protein
MGHNMFIPNGHKTYQHLNSEAHAGPNIGPKTTTLPIPWQL